jgi:endonuclease/exonuclease/phosphatase family metal-dependent hydrolase
VLFKRHVLDGFAAGTIDLAFRRWARPRVRAGGRLRTAVGVLSVDAVDRVNVADITPRDARRAGFASRNALLQELSRRADGSVYRVALHLAGSDPRAALRERDALADAELDEVQRRLTRLDAASRHGRWTMTVLRLIRDRPGVRAGDLAPVLGQDTQPFKRDVRKLKELGLTESLEVGYRLSARGRAVLGRLGKRTRRDG